MLIYKLNFKIPGQETTEKLFSADAIQEGKLRTELGRIFGWSGYASCAEEEDDAQRDRRFQRVFETMLMTLANNKIPNANITHKDRWATLELMEVA
jgi:hypothetical protein